MNYIIHSHILPPKKRDHMVPFFRRQNMRMYDIIHKKRLGYELSDEEIEFFVEGFTSCLQNQHHRKNILYLYPQKWRFEDPIESNVYRLFTKKLF